jgi:hypothetical protein
MEELRSQSAGEAPALAKVRLLGAAAPPAQEEARQGAAARRPLAARSWLVIGLATLAYAGHAWLFSGWVIDDAGISFVYARNLAAGHGLVSQPGMAPVEGFSNFLWVLLLAPAFRLGLFHPLLTPKLLSLALVAGSFLLLDRGVRQAGGDRRLSLALLLLLSLNTSFVIWTSSGLENPLYVFLLCALFRLAVAGHANGTRPLHPAGAGLLVTALALTRPDGILAGVLYPLLTLAPGRMVGSRGGAAAALVGAGRGRSAEAGEPRSVGAGESRSAGAAAGTGGNSDGWPTALARLAVYGGTVAVSLGAFLAFRLSYFGQLLPNTYYAKGGLAPHGLSNALTLQVAGVIKLLRLLGAVAGPGSGLLALALVAGGAYALARGWLGYLHLATAAFAAVPALAYMLLPVDWMPGFRFATGVLPFLYAFALALAATYGERLLPAARRPLASALAIAAAAGLSAAVFVSPSLLFAARPTVPFSQVADDYGVAFNRYAEMLDVHGGSILLPDLGGTLYTSRLRVYDLAGLCDRTIGRTLRRDPAAFHDYVLATLRPTFIHTHEYWTAVAGLDLDPRFRRDYVPLVEYVEDWVRVRTGLDLHSGDFVRRDAAVGHPEALRRIREELALRYRREIAASGPPAAVPADLSPGAPSRPPDLR